MFAPDMDDEITLNNNRRNLYPKVVRFVMCQLLMAIAFETMATFHDQTRLYIKSHPYISVIASIITLDILIGLACSKNVRHKRLFNFIFLFMVTLVLSFLLATSLSRYYPELVLLVPTFAILICLGITMFALHTTINLKLMGGFLMKALIVLLVASIITLFFPEIIITLIILCVGVIMYSLYLIYVIQNVVNGDNENIISLRDYIYPTFKIFIKQTIALYIITLLLLMMKLMIKHFFNV